MAVLFAWSPAAEARDEPIDISARTLPAAIAELSREAHVSIGSEGDLPRTRTAHVSTTSVGAALAQLLAGTGLVARRVSPSAWRIERAVQQPSPRSEPSAEAPPPQPAPAAPIYVTATKRIVALIEAPVALSTHRFDRGRQFDVASDSETIASGMEGIALSGQGPGRNRMYLRGVADSPFNGATQSTVAVLLDDARLTYAAPDPDIRLVDVDQVEVLKGPQGALYGTGALGGIYRIVTNRPDTDELDYAAGAAVQQLVDGQFGQSASVMANLPLVRDKAALRVVAYGANEPGWIDTGSNEDSNEGTVVGLRGGLGFDFVDGWRLDATGFGQWLNSADSHYVYAPSARSRPGQLPETHDNDLRHASLRLQRDGSLTVLLSTGVTWHEVRDRYDATVGAEGLGLADPQLLDDDREYRTWDSELRLSGSGAPFDWLGGLSHVEARQETGKVLTSASGTPLELDNDRRVTSDSALFGEATLPLGSGVDLLLGGRLFRTHFEQVRTLGVQSHATSRTRTGATPSAALSWRPRDGRLVYFRYGSAFRDGGTTVGSGGTLENLDGDELQTVEGGWREELNGGVLDLGIYLSGWENLQSDVLLAPGVIGTRNVGDARIAGAELSYSGAIARGWKADAGAMVQSAVLTGSESGIPLDDPRLPIVPDYTLRATVTHEFPLGPFHTQIDVGLRYVGPARLSFMPELDLPIDDYLESSLELRALLDNLQLNLKATNLVGTRDNTLVYGNPLRVLTVRQYASSQPPSISLEVVWRR